MQIFQTVNSVINIKDLHKQVAKIRVCGKDFKFLCKMVSRFLEELIPSILQLQDSFSFIHLRTHSFFSGEKE